VRRPQLQHHLLLGAEVQLLQVAALVEIPDVEPVTVLAGQQQLRIDAVLHHVRRSPFRGDHRVVPQVPPEVVRELLRPALLLPRPFQIKRLGVHEKDAAGAVAARRAERAAVHTVRPAVNSMGRAVAGLLDELFRLDHLYQLRLLRVGLRVEHVNPGRADAWDDQVAALNVRMRRLRAQACAARVPAEVMQLVVAVGKICLTDELAVCGGSRIQIDHPYGVRLPVLADVEHRDIRQALGRRLHGHAGRRIEGRVRTKRRHLVPPDW
jgi:hypothetical protein